MSAVLADAGDGPTMAAKVTAKAAIAKRQPDRLPTLAGAQINWIESLAQRFIPETLPYFDDVR